MKISRQPLLTVIAAIGLLATSASRLLADDTPIKYPKDEPVFTLDPAKADLGGTPVEQAGPAHPLHLSKSDGSKVPAYTIITIPVEKTVAEDLDKYLHAMARAMEVTDAKFVTESPIELPFEAEIATASVSGKIGNDLITTVVAGFRLQEKNFFAVVSDSTAHATIAKLTLEQLFETIEEVE